MSELINILTWYRIKHVFWSTFDFTNDISVIVDQGYVLFYDCVDRYLFKVKDLKFDTKSRNYMTVDDYVIFDFSDFVQIRFDIEGVVPSCQDYEFVDLQEVDKQMKSGHLPEFIPKFSRFFGF